MANIDNEVKQARKKHLNLPLGILKPLKTSSTEDTALDTDETAAKATKSHLKVAYDERTSKIQKNYMKKM